MRALNYPDFRTDIPDFVRDSMLNAWRAAIERYLLSPCVTLEQWQTERRYTVQNHGEFARQRRKVARGKRRAVNNAGKMGRK